MADRITDFVSRQDRIDLSCIGGLTFIGAAGFGAVAAEVRLDEASVMLMADIDGNGTADFAIQLQLGGMLAAVDLIL